MGRSGTITLVAVTAALSLTALAGCASTATPTGPATVTVTSAPSTAPPAPVEPVPAEPAAGNAKVPNGVGMNYQSAQDAWRAAGLIVMPGTDATGANRLMVLDSNWVVIAQDPPAGTKVEDGSEITATVKKYTDN